MLGEVAKRARTDDTTATDINLFQTLDPHIISDKEENKDDENNTNDIPQPLERDDYEGIIDEAYDELNQANVSETANEEMEIKSNRASTLRSLYPQLEESLTNIRATTKTLLNAVEQYAKEMESIEIDYIRCRASLRKEACRLDEVAPDVSRVTDCFSNLKQGSEDLLQ